MPPDLDSVLVDADALGEVQDSGRPASFVAGWNPTVAYFGLSPLVVFCFRHESGQEASWYLDQERNRVGGSVAELSLPLRLELMQAASRLFDGLWAKIMLTPVPPPLDEREAGFFRLPEGTRVEILALVLGGFDTATRFAAIDRLNPEQPDSPLLDLGSRRLALQRSHLQALFTPDGLQAQHAALIETGAMRFPSPVDGRPMAVRHALILHGVVYAYRAVDEATGTVMFLIAGEIYFRLTALFIPEGRICVAYDQGAMQMPQMFREFMARVMQHGDLLARYFARDDTTALHAWRGATAMHIGHVLWNDISGIDDIVRTVPQAALPRFAVFEAALEPEMYGPLDRIFPELEGLVERHAGGFQPAIGSFYEQGLCLIRSSSMFVPRSVRERILATVRPLDRASPASICALARADGVPVILFGIRVENRTIVELERFCTALVGHLAATLGQAVLVVDGHNSRIGEQDAFIWSHGEHGATRRPIEIERDLVEAMAERALGTGIEIVSTIGMPITESLACGREAQALIAIWGAGLAKYRWVCNIPGLIITNRWNLGNLGDLGLYHDPARMEAPTPVRLIPADAVEDLPDAPLVVRLGEGFIPSICNFRIDEAKAMAAIDAMLEEVLLVPA